MSSGPTIAIVAPGARQARALLERVRHVALGRATGLSDGSFAVVVLHASEPTLNKVLRAVDEWLVDEGIGQTRVFYGRSEYRLTAPPGLAAA